MFYRSAAAAQEAGFRPCLRCRPESSPDLAAWRGTSSTVSRALALIADGALDGDDADVEQLALRLGIGARQLRRLFEKHLGASPIAVAQTRRLLFAKQLIHETRMRMVDVAFAAGFGSLRRFNETFRRLYGRAPSTLRRQGSPRAASGRDRSGITLTLSYAAPYDWPAIIGFLAARAIPGVEVVEAERYQRTIELDGCHGTVEVTPATGRDALAVTIRFTDLRVLPTIVGRIRRVFDLGADVGAIAAHLAKDPWLAPLVTARPGLRLPGAWDGFEMAVRAVLGQQITVTAARRLAGKLVAAHGELSLEAIDLRDRTTGATTRAESGGLFIFIGADAETGWLPPEIALDRRGYVLTGSGMRATGRWTLDRDPYLLETSVPGIFACGDVRFGPVKRVAAAVGEGSMAIAFVHQFLREARPAEAKLPAGAT